MNGIIITVLLVLGFCLIAYSVLWVLSAIFGLYLFKKIKEEFNKED